MERKTVLKIGVRIGLGVAIALALPVVVAVFLPKEVRVERSIEIERPLPEVFDYVRLLKNQQNFSKWARMDPAQKTEYRGTDGQVGFVSAWDSANDEVGAGEQEILSIQDGERIEYALRFSRPFQASDRAWMATESVSPNVTRVTWGFLGTMKVPMNLMIPLMNMEEMLGDDFTEGLERLKGLLEAGDPAVELEEESEL